MAGIAIYLLGLILFAPELPGGPDGFGYKWIRSNDPGGPSFDWIDATTGQMIALGDDDTRWVSVPFSFWFYNGDYSDSIAISSNGWVSFTTATPNSPPFSWPDPIFGAALSVFGTDLFYDTVYVKTEGERLVIEWWNASLTAGGGSYTFEVVFDNSDSSVTFQYLSHQGADWNAFGYVFVGIQSRTTAYSLSVSSSLLQDSLAIKFYYEPEYDLSLDITYPGDGFLLIDSGLDSVRFELKNLNGTLALDVPVVCSVSTGGNPVFVDTVIVQELPLNHVYEGVFYGWQRMPNTIYRINVRAITPCDPAPENNADEIVQKIGQSAEDTITLYEQGVAGGVWFNSQFQAFGIEVEPDTLPFLLNYIGVWLLSPGDPGWPAPDTSSDPAVVEVWLGDTMPETRILRDTLLRDNTPPGWVYLVLTDSTIIWHEKFWVVVRTRLNSRYGVEALAHDSVLDHPMRQFVQGRDGVWHRQTFAEGDPVVFVAGTPVELRFRGDVELSYLYPAWSYVVIPQHEDSVIVEVRNNGPYSVSGITVSCILSDTEEPVLTDTFYLQSMAVGEADTFVFGTYSLDGEYDSLRLNCEAYSSQDSIQENNSFSAVIRAAGSANDTILFGTPAPSDCFVTEDTLDRIAIEIPSDTPRSFFKYGAIWLVTEGDPCYGSLDTVINPVIVEFWKGDSIPTRIMYSDTVYRDNVQPGWVYWIPPESIAMEPRMWLAIRLTLKPGEVEGLALDSTYDKPDSVWIYHNGTWVNAPDLSGDPIVAVYRDVTGNSITEDSDNSLKFGFSGTFQDIVTGPVRFSLSLPRREYISLKVYNVSGRLVKVLYQGNRDAGNYQILWDLRDRSGTRVPSGVYLLVLKGGNKVSTRRIVVIQ